MAPLLALSLLLVAGSSVVGTSQAVEHVVGDSTGWRVPSPNTFYSTWASGKNFSVGDVLVFNFTTGVHDVAVVTEDDYDNCNTANTIRQINTGPAKITLTNDTDYYFICAIPGHCTGGQKLEVDVGSGTTNSSTPPGTTTPPPPPSSAASSLVAALFVSLLSIAIGLLY